MFPEKLVLGTQAMVFQPKHSGHRIKIACQLYTFKPTECQQWETDDICFGIKLE